MPNRFLVYVLGHALQGEQVSVRRETCSAYYTAHSEYEWMALTEAGRWIFLEITEYFCCSLAEKIFS